MDCGESEPTFVSARRLARNYKQIYIVICDFQTTAATRGPRSFSCSPHNGIVTRLQLIRKKLSRKPRVRRIALPNSASNSIRGLQQSAEFRRWRLFIDGLPGGEAARRGADHGRSAVVDLHHCQPALVRSIGAEPEYAVCALESRDVRQRPLA